MAEQSTSFQTGGGGTNYEQAVQAAFIVSLVTRNHAPALPANEIMEVAFQNRKRGYQTDDLLVIARSGVADHRLLLQIKHNVSLSAGNNIFREVMASFWRDFNNTALFDKQHDRLVLVKYGLTQAERNHIKTLASWAVTHATAADFIRETGISAVKKDLLEMFRNLLQQASDGTAISDQDLWEFMRCFDMLDYDFLNKGSTSETHVLNLINLSKGKDNDRSAQEIWNEAIVIASRLNTQGGNLTRQSLAREPFSKHFSVEALDPYYKYVEKLRKDSDALLAPLKNTISGFHLQRSNVTEQIADAINEQQLTIVTGKPGVGKSAAIKEAITNSFLHQQVIALRADQFNKPHLANVLSEMGVHADLPGLFSCMSLVPVKIIFIDSLEKLLEAEPDCAFKQLLAVLEKHPEIKVVAASRKYAIDLIFQKFGLATDRTVRMEINVLSDEELRQLSDRFPVLATVLKNPKIRTLLRSPKYLDFAVTAIGRSGEDYAEISALDFKQKLWNELVVNVSNTKDGLPIKREKAFLDISVRRAREMRLFTGPGDSDPEAIQQLELDEMLFQDNHDRKYAPAHDILEDWALTRYINEKILQYPDPRVMFSSIGNEPAIRRAFRLWVEDSLSGDEEKILSLIRQTTSDKSIEPYWADELIIAVFRSDQSHVFFERFTAELLANDAKLFNRCVHLLRTCCKENFTNSKGSILVPAGSGWKQAVLFAAAHLTDLQKLQLPLVNLLADWHWKLLTNPKSADHAEQEAVKNIIIHYLQQAESGPHRAGDLITILFDLAPVAEQEIKNLVEHALANEKNRLEGLNKVVLEKLLTGSGNYTVVNQLPDLVIRAAWVMWKEKPVELEQDSFMAPIGYGHRDADESWGIDSEVRVYPAGIYKTPFYFMLSGNRAKALQFIVQFINYTVDYHIQTDNEYKQPLTKIVVELNDGTKVAHWGSSQLWTAFRGATGMHDLVVSLLISLEKYLLEITEVGVNEPVSRVTRAFDYLLRNSNNVAVAGVLSSVAMAFPQNVGEAMLPLMKVRQFYEWDMQRALMEMHTLAPMDTDNMLAQRERYEFNQLPHRNQFLRGMRDFIRYYQVNIRVLNPKLFLIFDELKTQVPADDIMWNKAVTEMDIRNHTITAVENQPGVFLLEPQYDKQVNDFLDSQKEEDAADNKAAGISNRLRSAYEKKIMIGLHEWREAFEHYQRSAVGKMFFDKPITCAHCGLRDFADQLNASERKWCLDVLIHAIENIEQDATAQQYGGGLRFNIMEKDPALFAFHLVLANLKNRKKIKKFLATALRIFTAPLPDVEVKKLFPYFRDTFQPTHPDEFRQLWGKLIAFAEVQEPAFDPYTDPGTARTRYRTWKNRQISKLVRQEQTSFDFASLSFDSDREHCLHKALLMTPYTLEDPAFDNFVASMIPLVIAEVARKDDYSFRPSRRERKLDPVQLGEVQLYLASLMLNGTENLSKKVFDLLFDSLPAVAKDLRGRKDELFTFISDTIRYVIGNLEIFLGQTTDAEKKAAALFNFGRLWSHFRDKIITTKNYRLLTTWFLDVGWPHASRDSEILFQVKDIYVKMIDHFGTYLVPSLLRIFSTVGDKLFLPPGMSKVVRFLKNDPSQTSSLISREAEQLIERLFHHHISVIKKDQLLVNDYLWLLNAMTDLGSSNAYFFRENMIVYKAN